MQRIVIMVGRVTSQIKICNMIKCVKSISWGCYKLGKIQYRLCVNFALFWAKTRRFIIQIEERQQKEARRQGNVDSKRLAVSLNRLCISRLELKIVRFCCLAINKESAQVDKFASKLTCDSFKFLVSRLPHGKNCTRLLLRPVIFH